MSQEVVAEADVQDEEEGDDVEVTLEGLLKDYEAWLNEQDDAPKLKLQYDSEEDLWEIEMPGQGSLVAYMSDIDSDFYGEPTALFLECELGPPDPQTDLSKLLIFSGQELVLARISLSERDGGEHVLVVESACPVGQIEFELLDLMIREVLAIAGDVRGLIGGK